MSVRVNDDTPETVAEIRNLAAPEQVLVRLSRSEAIARGGERGRLAP